EDGIRDRNVTGVQTCALPICREASALEIQREYMEKVQSYVDRQGTDATGKRVLDLWQRALEAVETQNFEMVSQEIDWMAKYLLLERYRSKYDLSLSSPRVAQLDLTYHDIHRDRGLFYLMQKRGQMDRVVNDLKIFEAKSVPPQTTRARLRGEFIRRAQEQ